MRNMLAGCLAMLLAAELAVLCLFGALLRARGYPVAAAVGACMVAAFSWRAGIVALGMVLARVHRVLDRGGTLGRPRAWAALWLRETLAMSAAYLSMTVEPLVPAVPRRVPIDAGPAVVLIHGWCCNAGVWRAVAQRLRRAGIANLHGVTLRPVLGSIDTMALDLDRQVAPLRAPATDRRIVLAAHSMGGLVARAWLGRLDAAVRARVALVTIGSPHRGTLIAALGAGTAARQMRPGSAWLAALASAAGQSCDITCIGSRTDNFVAPQESAWLPGSRRVEVAAAGHFSLLRAPGTRDALIEACRARAGRHDS
jgi:predicted alpha/beta hydrolase family esterase